MKERLYSIYNFFSPKPLLLLSVLGLTVLGLLAALSFVVFEEDISDKKVVIWKIDKQTTNPYRLFQKLGKESINEEEIALLRKEGILKPWVEQSGNQEIFNFLEL